MRAADVVRKFARGAKPNYVEAFEVGDDLLAEAGIDRPLRLAHFMAQCLHETGGLTILVERGNYTARNLGDMWDSGNWHRYFANRDACVAMAEQCRRDEGVALFSLVYGNRMGNGPPSTQDGWRYRGRGVLQTTGRDSYRRYGDRIGVDLVGQPDVLVEARHVLRPALADWVDKNLNVAADSNDIEVVTQGINGGQVGISERKAWFARVWPYINGGAPVHKTLEWRVQEALKAAGFEVGTVDGVVGPKTRSAIVAFRTSRELTLRPDISDDLLRSLGL